MHHQFCLNLLTELLVVLYFWIISGGRSWGSTCSLAPCWNPSLSASWPVSSLAGLLIMCWGTQPITEQKQAADTHVRHVNNMFIGKGSTSGCVCLCSAAGGDVLSVWWGCDLGVSNSWSVHKLVIMLALTDACCLSAVYSVVMQRTETAVSGYIMELNEWLEMLIKLLLC